VRPTCVAARKLRKKKVTVRVVISGAYGA
jgi:hypothetical protein